MAFLGRYWDAAGWTILHFLWLGTAVGLLCALARLLLRRAAPQVRYVVTLAFLAILAAGPPVIFGVVLKRQAHDPTASDLSVAATDEDLDRLAGGTLAGSLSGGSGSLAASVGEPAPTLSQADQWIARAENGLTWTVNALPWLWLVGAPATLAYLLTGVAGAERLRRSSRTIDDGPIAELCLRWCDALGVARQVLVGVSERVATPILLGITRPLVLLPPSMVTGWPLEQVEMVLLHELAHVRRLDNLVNLVQRLVESALFFHPAVWKVSSWARLDREQCCDATVLEHLGPPQMYAETLAALAVPGLAPRHAVAALANHQLVSRIRHILKREERTMRLSLRWLSVVVVAAITSAALVTAWAQTTGLGAGGVAAPAATGVGVASGDGWSDWTIATRITPLNVVERAAAGGNCRGLVVGDIDNDGVPDILVASTGQRVESMQCTSCHANVHDVTTSVVEAGSGWQFYLGSGLSRAESGTSGAPWGPEQATGPPNTKPGNDVATAWASRTTDGQPEWLEVTFEKSVTIAAVMIHETLNPGAVGRIQAGLANRKGLGQFRTIWEGEDPIGRRGPGGMSIISIDKPQAGNGLRLEIRSDEVPGWNEIDAVGIIDTQGQVQWATSAKASSSYAEVVAAHRHRSIDPRDQQIRALEKQLQQLQSELQQLKASQATSGVGTASGLLRVIKGDDELHASALHLGSGSEEVRIEAGPTRPIASAGSPSSALSGAGSGDEGSRSYYIIVERTGQDKKLSRVPCTGNETVLDALAQVQGLSDASNIHVWIARPASGGSSRDQILPVDSKITKSSTATSNYQLLPGDRVFVTDDKSPAALQIFLNQGDSSTTIEQPAGNSTLDAALAAAAETDEVVQFKAQLEAAQAQLVEAQATMAKALADEEQARALAERRLERAKRYHADLLARQPALAQDQAQAAEAQAEEMAALSRHYDQAVRAQAMAAQRRLADAEMAHAQAAQTQQNAESTQRAADLAQHQDRLAELATERAQLVGELRDARRKERTARIHFESSEGKFQEISEEYDRTQAELEAVNAEASTRPDDLARASVNLKAINLAHLREQIEQAKSELRGVRWDRIAAQLEIAEVQRELKSVDEQIAKLRAISNKALLEGQEQPS